MDIKKFDDIVIDVKDKEGRHIICTKSQWVFHVCDPKSDHEYMKHCMDDVVYALENADRKNFELLVDRDDKDKLTLDYQMKHRTDSCLVRVVVKFRTLDYLEGEVVTAFMPDKIRERDKPLWQSKKS